MCFSIASILRRYNHYGLRSIDEPLNEWTKHFRNLSKNERANDRYKGEEDEEIKSRNFSRLG